MLKESGVALQETAREVAEEAKQALQAAAEKVAELRSPEGEGFCLYLGHRWRREGNRRVAVGLHFENIGAMMQWETSISSKLAGHLQQNRF